MCIRDRNDLKEGWNILRNKKYSGQIYMYDSERDSFMVALKDLGYSMNKRNKDALKQAYNWLIEQNNTMKPVYVGDCLLYTYKCIPDQGQVYHCSQLC